MRIRSVSLLLFTFVFSVVLGWRVYALCCDVSPGLESYHSCSSPPDVICGSGQKCYIASATFSAV